MSLERRLLFHKMFELPPLFCCYCDCMTLRVSYSVDFSGFPIRAGSILGKMAKNYVKVTKSTIFGQYSGMGDVEGQINFLSSMGDTTHEGKLLCVPLIWCFWFMF